MSASIWNPGSPLYSTNADLVTFTPTPTIAATDVQAAIEEVDTENRALSAAALAAAAAADAIAVAAAAAAAQGVSSVDLANTSNIGSGDALVGVKLNASGAVARTQHSKNEDVINILDFGAVGDGVTDDTAAFQAAVNYVQAAINARMVIYLPARAFLISGTITVTGSVVFRGEGYLDFENTRPITRPPKGSWLIHGSASGPLFQFSGNLGKGSGLWDIAIFQTGHAAPGMGWTPTVKDWVIRNENTEGTLQLVRVHFHNVYQGVLTDKSHRPHYEDITGQFFYRAFSFDQIYDLGKFEGLHAWTYWSEHDVVLQWQQANAVAITLLRVDGLFIDRIFTFAVETAIYVGTSAYGTARAVLLGSIYADFTARAIVVDATTNAELQVGNIYHLGQAWPVSPVAALPNSAALDVSAGSNHNIQIGHVRSVLTATYSLRVIGTANRAWICSALLEQYDKTVSGLGACYVTTTNTIHFSVRPGLSRADAATPYLFTGAPGGLIYLETQRLAVSSEKNIPVTAAGATGVQAVFTVEGDTNASLSVVCPGTGTLELGALANKLSFFGSGGVVQPNVTGSTAGNVALQNLCSALAQLGLIVNSTT